jgi:hypothetical protein
MFVIRGPHSSIRGVVCGPSSCSPSGDKFGDDGSTCDMATREAGDRPHPRGLEPVIPRSEYHAHPGLIWPRMRRSRSRTAILADPRDTSRPPGMLRIRSPRTEKPPRRRMMSNSRLEPAARAGSGPSTKRGPTRRITAALLTGPDGLSPGGRHRRTTPPVFPEYGKAVSRHDMHPGHSHIRGRNRGSGRGNPCGCRRLPRASR